jgi:hypothetical protein
MLNYEIDPAILRPLVPAGVELDSWQGSTLVSMVGFQFFDTRLLGLPIPFHRNFDEVNLRFYVRREVGDDVDDGVDDKARRGVVFVKEIVPRRVIAWVANVLYNERYVALPMFHDDGIGVDGRLTYRWQHAGRTCRLGATAAGELFQPAAGSEEEFITEHYWGYVGQRDGSTMEYRVEHPRWRVWSAHSPDFSCDVAALYGSEFAACLGGTPRSCFVAKGSEVRVRRGRRI